MDRLSEYETFLEVTRQGSFSGAARQLGVTASAVSKQVKALEERLGARLFQRTTRRVALTDAGRAFSDRATEILHDVEEAESAVAAGQSEPRGVLRVGAPMDFGRLHLARSVADFAAQHPLVSMEVELVDRFVDLVDEGLDVVVRIADMPDSSLVSRRLAPCRRVLCASPGWLADHGRPAEPDALREHGRIAYAYEAERAWTFDTPDGDRLRVDPPVAHRSNNGELTCEMVAAGLGIALLPTFLAADAVRAGRIETLFADRLRSTLSIQAVYPHRRHLSAKVRAFVDHLASHCGPQPYWDDGLDLEAGFDPAAA